MAVCIEFIYDTEEHAKALADYQKIFYFNEGGPGMYNELVVQQSTHVFVFGNLSGTVQWKLVDLNGSAPTSYTILKRVRIRVFDPYIVLKSHLKPISVGDKLGLVYWDGDHSIGGNYIHTSNVAGDKGYMLNVDAGYFNYYTNGNYIKLLDKAGTVNLNNLLGATDMTVSAIRGTEFQKHLFHVI